MMYLITFERELYTLPLSVGQYLVMQDDDHGLDTVQYAAVEKPLAAEDVLQPALRNGFTHPGGLVVDSGLVDTMTAPGRLAEQQTAQQEIQDQLAELDSPELNVSRAAFHQKQDQLSRDANLDFDEAQAWAKTARKDLLARPVNSDLKKYWEGSR